MQTARSEHAAASGPGQSAPAAKLADERTTQADPGNLPSSAPAPTTNTASQTPPPKGYVRLRSGDGFTFTIDVEYARLASTVIHTMMQSTFKEARTRIIELPHVTGEVLEIVCQYFYYIVRFRAAQQPRPTGDGGGSVAPPSPEASQDGADAATTTPSQRPLPFDHFVETFDVPVHLSIDVFLCAKYLDL